MDFSKNGDAEGSFFFFFLLVTHMIVYVVIYMVIVPRKKQSYNNNVQFVSFLGYNNMNKGFMMLNLSITTILWFRII